VLVVPVSVPAKTVAEFIALAKAQPGKLNYSSAGAGTTQHLSGVLLKTLTKTQIQHVPYKGSAPSLTALITNEVQMSFANIPAISQHVKAGKLRALALTGAKRSDQLPDVPTLKESGINMDVDVWYGVLAPAKTPPAIVNRLSQEIAKVAKAPDIHKRLVELGAEPRGTTPEEFSKLLKSEVTTWAEVVKASGATAD
jgi:tripartite-type tricarboxylate transporter receptor subunit TctC